MARPLKELLQSWQNLCRLHEERGDTVLELIAHPDATPEQIAQVREAFMATRKVLTDNWPRVLKAFDGSWSVRPKPPMFMQRRIEMNKRRKEGC